MGKMKAVKLRTRHKLCNAGEIAGFPADEADNLVDKGIAYHIDENNNPIVPSNDDDDVEEGSSNNHNLVIEAILGNYNQFTAKEISEAVFRCDSVSLLQQIYNEEKESNPDRKGVFAAVESRMKEISNDE